MTLSRSPVHKSVEIGTGAPPQVITDAGQVRLHTIRIVEEARVIDMHTHLSWAKESSGGGPVSVSETNLCPSAISSRLISR